MTKFSLVLSDGTVHSVDGCSLRVEYSSGIQDIPFAEVTAILAAVNAGQQISAQIAEIEAIGDIGPVQEDQLDSLDDSLSGIISMLFGMPEEEDNDDEDYDDNIGEADGSNPIEPITEATIIRFPGK